MQELEQKLDDAEAEGLDSVEQNEIEYNHYKELEAYAVKTESEPEPEPDAKKEEVESEEMTALDAEMAAGFFINNGAAYVESMFSQPVTIDHDTKQAIADKAVPVVLKYSKGANLPPWLVRYREEIELIAVLAGAGFSIFSQIKIAKANDLKATKTQSNEMKFDSSGEVKVGC